MCIMAGLGDACMDGGLCVSDAISLRGALGSRIPPTPRGGDDDAEDGREERADSEGGMLNDCTEGELYDEGGSDPDEYTDTFSSQSLVAPPFAPLLFAPEDKLEDVLETEARR